MINIRIIGWVAVYPGSAGSATTRAFPSAVRHFAQVAWPGLFLASHKGQTR
jgi:hypothetical protein